MCTKTPGYPVATHQALLDNCKKSQPTLSKVHIHTIYRYKVGLCSTITIYHHQLLQDVALQAHGIH